MDGVVEGVLKLFLQCVAHAQVYTLYVADVRALTGKVFVGTVDIETG